jgi:hypothetical protein
MIQIVFVRRMPYFRNSKEKCHSICNLVNLNQLETRARNEKEWMRLTSTLPFSKIFLTCYLRIESFWVRNVCGSVVNVVDYRKEALNEYLLHLGYPFSSP